MEIWNCEFCNTSVTNFEVHYCRNFGNQHRQSFATLPRSSSANWVQDTESRTALPMNYEARWPDMSQFNSSIQQSVLPNMHLRTDWEAAATAEISSSYGIAKYNQYNLEISDFLLPNMPHGPENQYNSTTLPNADQLNPMPVAEPCSLPGFQQAFGQRNTLMNQIHQHPNACQMDSSGTSRTDVMSSSFTFAFNEIDNISNNQISQHYETSSGIPILAVQNAQFNPMDPVPPTDAISPIHSKECPKEFLPKDYLEPQDRSHSVARPYASSYCDKTFPCSAHLTRHIRTHTGDKPYACTMNFGNQHRQSSATLPHSCSGNRDQDIDVRTQQMHYEERRPSMNETYSSWQQSILPNMHQRTDCEAAAATEIASPYGIGNQNPYNPEISHFQFPDLQNKQESQSESTHLLQPFEDNSAIMNQNPQFWEAWNPKYPANSFLPDAEPSFLPVAEPSFLPVAEPSFLPVFQQKYGQINPLTNQTAQHPNASAQTEYSGISRTNGMSSHFTSDFNESAIASTNQISQHYETSLGIPILAFQNVQYNPMDPIHQTDLIGPIHSSPSHKEFLPKDHFERQDHSRGVEKSYACNYCSRTFLWSSHLTTHICTHRGEKPYACTVCNKRFAANFKLTEHMRIHTVRPYTKCKECSECFVNRYRLQEHVRIIHKGQKSFKCTECSECFVSHYRLLKHIHTADELNKCTECSKCFVYPSQLREHVRTIHTANETYKCTECDKCFPYRSSLRKHIRSIHNAEKPYKCTECGQRFTQHSSLRTHSRNIHADDRS
ncbi:hypothetical protein CDAR_217311 [Caerostris darwini]|uniref:C2H2-type domain-containing protein n=1 Tax=Caerostris darwini TaxID=1538125 RepID=A0AAV4NFE0_9ARAC|nr:hypothetical protein CDAR_217311 [Caerostris darwini]